MPEPVDPIEAQLRERVDTYVENRRDANWETRDWQRECDALARECAALRRLCREAVEFVPESILLHQLLDASAGKEIRP